MPTEFKGFKISKGYDPMGYIAANRLEFTQADYEPYENYQKWYFAMKKRINKKSFYYR